MLTTKASQLSMPLPLEKDAWNFNGVDTQYATHGLHTYLAAMIPQLARGLIELYVPRHGTVLDPFCGGGAVLVEAILSARSATGIDINDLAVLISRAKTTHIPQDDILRTRSIVLEKAHNYQGEPIQFRRGDYVNYWFKPYMMKPLTALRYAIDEIPDRSMQTLYRVIFSATVRSVSLTYRNEIRLRRMRKDQIESFNPDVFEKFASRAKEAAERVAFLPRGASAEAYKGTVIDLPFSDEEFTSIVCSPPYGDERNGVPYVQFARNMLMWLGYTRRQIMESKRLTLGWEKNDKKPPPSNTLLHALELIQDNSTACREAIAFYADYHQALQEMARVVSDTVIIVIGQRVLHRTVFDNAAITTELMKEIGLPLKAFHMRKLPSKRLPKMREFGAAIDHESMLVFQK